ncbi:Acyl carrier protein [Aphelenchoides bicaudatus]|nr:Acyl carrier protein [Aphelenchoides bicaudatus]
MLRKSVPNVSVVRTYAKDLKFGANGRKSMLAKLVQDAASKTNDELESVSKQVTTPAKIAQVSTISPYFINTAKGAKLEFEKCLLLLSKKNLSQMQSQIAGLHTSTLCSAAHQPFTMKTVQDRIMLVLSLYDKIDTKKLTMDSNFFTDLGLDSLDFVEVIMVLEDEFQFEIPDGDMDRMKTPRDIYQYICDKEDVYS